MRRNLLLIGVALTIVLGLTLILDNILRPVPPSIDQLPEISALQAKIVPDFSFTPLGSSASQDISDFKGKIVLLNFWASWCAPCVIEFPKLRELARVYKDDLIVLAVSADSDSADISKFLKKNKHTPQDNFLVVPDPEKSISQDLFQTIRLPETIIIDPSGQMVRKVVGDTDWTGPEMRAYLSGLVAPQPTP